MRWSASSGSRDSPLRHNLLTFGIEEFRRERWDYRPGEHVCFTGRTQFGKTTLACLLLEVTASPKLPAYVLVVKPRDRVIEYWSERFDKTTTGCRVIREYPVMRRVRDFDEPPSVFVVWPKLGDIYKDPVVLEALHRKVLADRYAKGVKKQHSIVMADETRALSKELNLDKEMVGILTRGGAMGVGLWTFLQKPTDSGTTSVWSYEQVDHLFITKQQDERNSTRLDEIGGLDKHEVMDIVSNLKPFQQLYIRPGKSEVCIIDTYVPALDLRKKEGVLCL